MNTIEQAQEISGIGYWQLDFLKDELIWSKQVYTIFRVDPEHFKPSYEMFLQSIHPDDREMINEAYSKSIELKKPYSIQHRLKFDDNSIGYVLEKCETYFDENGSPLKSSGTIQDITESVISRNKLEASQNKFMAISNQTTEGITVADMDGNYVFVNPAFCKMSGYTEEELLRMTVFDMKAKDQNHSSFKNSKEKMEGIPMKVNLQKKDGTEYFTEIIGDVIQVDNESFVLGTIRDITERIKHEETINKLNIELESAVIERTLQLNNIIIKLSAEVEQRKIAEEKLKESLAIKEILFKEITHRVKNNMQIISSIINLQKSYLDKDSSDILEQISHRIHSMALIHETLYKTNEFEGIQFKFYLKSLIKYMRESYDSTNISINLVAEEKVLPLDIGTSCGMIIIELVTNSIKHANLTKDIGKIDIHFEEIKPNNYRLSISDNGVGFPENIDFKKSRSLGLQLVTSMVEQIMGEIKLTNNNGTTFEITFQTPSLLN